MVIRSNLTLNPVLILCGVIASKFLIMIFENDYPNGLDMEQFERVEAISFYNHNYYKGVKTGDVLHGKSDDDNTTEWYLIRNQSMNYLGESYCSENEKLNRYEERCT